MVGNRHACAVERADGQGVVRSDCPRGGVRLVCRLETSAAIDGLRTVTVEVYLAEDGGRPKRASRGSR